MDTSPEYIKMCEGAEEIQKVWEISYGDFFVFKHPDYWGAPAVFYHQHIPSDLKEVAIWLPRQDQLQEMVAHESIYNLLDKFDVWGKWDQSLYDSMEKLWLAFVMKERYNKTWNGKEWVK